MAAQTVICPHCGLVLTVKRVKGGTHISYSPGEWRRLCKHPDLDSPALCLLQGGGNGDTASSPGSASH